MNHDQRSLSQIRLSALQFLVGCLLRLRAGSGVKKLRAIIDLVVAETVETTN